MRLIAEFGSPRHHDFGIFQRDQARRVADRMGSRRACGDDRMVRTLETMLNRDIASGKIDKTARNKERRNAARALFLQDDRGLGDAAEAADPSAD